MAHLHKRFKDSQVKALLERYGKGEIERKYIELEKRAIIFK